MGSEADILQCRLILRLQTYYCAAANGRKGPCVDGSALARTFFSSQAWSEQPCVRPLCAVHMTAGHNALRGSGPGQFLALDSAVARVGCPDLRIDRICITCCSSFQPSHHAVDRRDLVYAARAAGSLALSFGHHRHLRLQASRGCAEHLLDGMRKAGLRLPLVRSHSSSGSIVRFPQRLTARLKSLR